MSGGPGSTNGSGGTFSHISKAANDAYRQQNLASYNAEMAAKGFEPNGRGGYNPISQVVDPLAELSLPRADKPLIIDNK